MKKIVFFLLLNFFTLQASAQHIPRDVVSHIAEFVADSPQDLMNLAEAYKEFYCGIKQLMRLKHYKDDAMKLLFRVRFETFDKHDTRIKLPTAKGELYKELSIKHDQLTHNNLITLLDYLIVLHDARTLTSKNYNPYKRLLKCEKMVINVIKKNLPKTKQAFICLLRAITTLKINQKTVSPSLYTGSNLAYKKEKRNILRLFYLSLAVNKNNKHYETLCKYWIKTIGYRLHNIYSTFLVTLLFYFSSAVDVELLDSIIARSQENKELISRLFTLSVNCNKHDFILHLLPLIPLKTIKELFSLPKLPTLEATKLIISNKMLPVLENGTFIEKDGVKEILWFIHDKALDRKLVLIAEFIEDHIFQR